MRKAIPHAAVMLLLLGLPACTALAEPVAADALPAVAASETGDPLVQYLLGLGPIGALVYGAYLLGRGVKVSVEVSLADQDRKLAERAASALERIGGCEAGAQSGVVQRIGR